MRSYIVVERIILCGANAIVRSVANHVVYPQMKMVILVMDFFYKDWVARDHLGSTCHSPYLPSFVSRSSIFVEASPTCSLHRTRNTGGYHRIYKARIFYIMVLLILFELIPKGSHMVTDSRINPIDWSIEFVLQHYLFIACKFAF